MLSPEARLLTPKHGRGIARFFTEWSTRGLETQRQLHISRKYTRAFLRRRRGCFERRRWQLQAQRRLRTGGTLCICSVFCGSSKHGQSREGDLRKVLHALSSAPAFGASCSRHQESWLLNGH